MMAIGAGATVLLLSLFVILLAGACGAEDAPAVSVTTASSQDTQSEQFTTHWHDSEIEQPTINSQDGETEQPTINWQDSEEQQLAIPKAENEVEGPSAGIDLARYQGTVDWAKVAADGIDFAMIRVGYRSSDKGVIVADSNARYNMQEAAKHGVHIGVYFFSTAITEAEALEEADWVADYIARYPITYPVAFNCEGFDKTDSRQQDLTVEERTDLALAFLERIGEHGYIPMFYASQSELDSQWQTARIASVYRIWVAQYPQLPYPQTPQSSYTGSHHMWQYTHTGQVSGVAGMVDRDVAWFGFSQPAKPKDPTPAEQVGPDVEAMMTFREVKDSVTAKISTNLRSIPSQDQDSAVLSTLQNGEWVTRTGVSDSGWSRLERDGMTCYAVTSYLTTDANYSPEQTKDEDEDGIATVFIAVSDNVTAKDVVNLRSIPSVTREDSVVVAQLEKGQWIPRTGINEDVGWSRVVYNGQILYCITSYLETDSESQETTEPQ